ncbi:LysM peptidoglycan-binding domain-containing protein [Spirosoma taeanense]|uniref:LysM peptidoglycan-binding domain-containing protein n=1 Tax=Spirosoma taeanense TaxID=2735870 RepID=A0A6M5Y6I7_9BACT|nr:LysM peptidoglycan-binding domain-containing protein [Spirosoma taeanense]QJW88970.1 LysM peptidoglycan-binding domain-containing protein [Spirosoma taeanense]
MKTYIPLFVLPLLMGSIAHAHTVADSVGVEKKDGKRFILHRVDQGQTLYSIARRYRSSVDAIRSANPDLDDAVRYDHVVRIPIPDGALSRKEAKAIDKAIRKEEKALKRDVKEADNANPVVSSKAADKKADAETRKNDDPAKAGIHIVEPGQTLYSLAVRYGVSQADLRRWNSLGNDNVLIGQALIVSEKAYVVRVPATSSPSVTAKASAPERPAETRSAESRTETPPRTAEARSKPEPARPERTIESRPAETRPVATSKRPDESSTAKTESRPTAAPKAEEVEVEMPRPGNDAPMPTRGRRIATSGVAEMIEGADESGKYLALHRTAPIGTLVQVRNEFNNQSLWVKVIGRLPDTGVNDKILIKLSTQAFAKLSPEDRRFRAEVSYIVK